MLKHHRLIETNIVLLGALTLITIAIGGIVEIVPLFTIETTIERVEGVRPYTPLELAGRSIYIREGCYNCHSQQIRPFRDEVERYGHYSLAAESMYDFPFQWGSKRTGPDLARVGGKYSGDWHVQHLIEPRGLVPETIMPAYAFMAHRPLEYRDIALHLRANRRLGVPYTDDMITHAATDLVAQADPRKDSADLLRRYPKTVVAKYHGDPDTVTELDALVAYLQMLGTLVDVSAYRAKDLQQ
ncbi:MAG: cytochrome-c oxidase, cbb3-type subunit II [Alphaproteobacteria bacterium]|nr:cytochrome-c oxidase, cbb3-type subunit II [Alphaproteobacteria bacterium]